jgi:hypothetical protein
MKSKSVLIVAALCILVAALFMARPSIAQNDGASAPGKDDEEDLPIGRYSMAASAGDLFLCDTTNGESWRMKVVRKTDDGILMNWRWESAAPAVVNSR